MKYKGIIFDLDGVICSTDEYHYQAWKKIADSLGIQFDQNVNNRLRGVSRMESLDIILEGYYIRLSEEQKYDLATEKNNYYIKLLKNMTKTDLSDEVMSTLEYLRKMNIKLAIGSSSKNAGTILNKLGLGEYFDAVCDGNQIQNSKPDPEVFQKACFALGFTPTDCIVVEDAKAGIQAAILGGFDSVAIGQAAECKLATYEIANIKEIIDIV